MTLGLGLLDLLTRFSRGVVDEPEVMALAALLEVQARWSSVPTRDDLLVEVYETRDGFHLMLYPFAGRILNEGLASLVASRLALETPRTFAIASTEYGCELLCEEPFEVHEDLIRRVISAEQLMPDLLKSINLSELARRQFRDIAQIAGLVDPGTPGKQKSARQLQASSGLMFDVLERHDSDSLLLEQSRREVLDAQLDYVELRGLLTRLMPLKITIRRPPRLTPLAFPLWADRLQTQMLSTESWRTRIERESKRLEKLAR